MRENEPPEVGNIAEEAVKLLAALQEWTRESSAAAGTTRAAGDLWRDLNEHVATGADECRYCPLCQVIAAIRATSPEVKHHLGIAASSLLKAATGFLAASVDQPGSRSGSPVERIDLDDESWEEQDR